MAKKNMKTEVDPFWNIEDIVAMIRWFEKKEMWHWWWVFHAGILLGRRIGDTMMFKFSDFFNPDGTMKDEFDVLEEKTEKVNKPYISDACKKALQTYIEKTGLYVMDYYDTFVVTTREKEMLLTSKQYYDDMEEWESDMEAANDKHIAAFRKQFKNAAKECGITYSVSCHSLRKTIGFYSVKLHPYDNTVVDILQKMYGHSDRNTTLIYTGLSREKEVKLYEDMGNFLDDIKDGKKPVIKNSPVIPLKSEDFRELLSKCWDMAQSGMDKFEGLNEIINLAEERMV